MRTQEETEIEQENTLTDVEDTIDDVLNEMNATEADVIITFSVYRVLGSAKDGLREPFLFEGDASMIGGIKTRLLNEYGSGTYRIRIFHNRRLKRRFDVAIEVPKAAPTQASHTGDTGEILRSFSDMQRENREFMERVLNRLDTKPIVTATQGPDPLALIERIGAFVMPLIVPLINRPVQNTGMELVEALKSGMEIATNATRGGEEKGVTGILSELLRSPVVAQIAGSVAQGNNQPKPQPNQQFGTLTVPSIQPPSNSNLGLQPQPVNSAPSNGGMDEQTLMFIRGQLDVLVNAAVNNKNPELYAELLLDQFPPHLRDFFLKNDNIIEVLSQFHPAVQQLAWWFNSTLAIAREMSDDGEKVNLLDPNNGNKPSADSGFNGFIGRSRRDAGNAQADAKPSKSGEEKS